MNSLLVYSNHGFGSHSSYSVVSKYISNCSVLSAIRREPNTLGQKVLNRVARTFAASQWYRLTSLELEWLLIQRLYQSRPDLIHFLWAERDLGYIDLLASASSLPICCTFHSCPEELPEVFPHRKRLKNLSGIIIMSETQRPFFEACGVASHKIHCIPHGIDTDFFIPLNNSKTSNKFELLSVGSYKRNFSLLRESAIKLRKYPDIYVKIISSEGFRHYFSDLDNVEFISGLTDLELLAAYQSASCLLLTVENATANNALLEGLACGLPIIAEDIGGISEYTNSDCALLTEPRNADLLVESIVRLAESSSKRDEMSRAARARALELAWEKVAKMTEKLYLSLQ